MPLNQLRKIPYVIFGISISCLAYSVIKGYWALWEWRFGEQNAGQRNQLEQSWVQQYHLCQYQLRCNNAPTIALWCLIRNEGMSDGDYW